MGDEEMMADGAGENYPGVEFSPPAGTIGDEPEGEAMVRWKKVGDRYTITEFEGKPIGGNEEAEPVDRKAALRSDFQSIEY